MAAFSVMGRGLVAALALTCGVGCGGGRQPPTPQARYDAAARHWLDGDLYAWRQALVALAHAHPEDRHGRHAARQLTQDDWWWLWVVAIGVTHEGEAPELPPLRRFTRALRRLQGSGRHHALDLHAPGSGGAGDLRGDGGHALRP